MITDKPEFDIRYTVAEDEVPLRKWLNWPGILDWYPMTTEPEVNMMVKNWIGFAKYKCSLTATYKGKPVGIATLFLMPYRKVAHHGMLHIIVDPKFHGQGIGTALLRNIKHLGKTKFRLEDIHFDLYEGCKAYSLLLKQGFVELFRQEEAVMIDGKKYARIVMEVPL